MGIMNDQPTVKEHCENWGRKHGIIMTADQQVEELTAKNEALQAESTLLYKKVRANEILFDQAKAENAKLKAVLVSIRACLSATKGGLLEDSREEAIARLSLIFDDCAEGLKE